jgi:hypothetical protein
MDMKKMLNKAKLGRKADLFGGILLLVVFVGPIFAFASHRSDMYVDVSASGTQDGSVSHPFKTITEALKHSSSKTDVHVAKGEYKENISIPKGVKVFGSDKNDVIIKADDTDKSVVTMYTNSEINKVTVKKGTNGIKVKNGAKVSIIKCIIRDNDNDGIKIEEGPVWDTRMVSITDSTIKDNGRSGIFSKKRRLVIMDNEISGNDSDGVNIEAGSKVWLQDNKIKDNSGSGMSLTLDGSDIWTKSNTLRGNGHDGIEINAYGKNGRIDINKSFFVGNAGYGVSRIQRAFFPASVWSGLTVQKNVNFDSNDKGTTSSVIRVVK